MWFGLLAAAATGLSPSCGGDTKEGPCKPGIPGECESGRVCELVAGGDPACFEPLELKGRILDSADGSGVGGATVAAVDSNGAVRSLLAESAEDGSYVLPIPTERDEEGKPLAEPVTLRVDAQGYQSFPLPPRTALPVDLGTAVEEPASSHLVVGNAATDVLLVALEGGAAGLAVVNGRVEGTPASGFLVVAESEGQAVATALTDFGGDFRLFNVPKGDLSVSAFRQGAYAPAQTVTVSEALVDGVVLPVSVDGLSKVSGKVSLVNVSGSPPTSVILVLASTFDPDAVRGEAPLGLRAAGVTNAFEIADVPPGQYAVLAAFENDGLVRDPDTSIGGTQIVYAEVDGTGAPVALDAAFKVTGALDVVSPGAKGMEFLSTAEPTFTWADDSSEDGYELTVFDAQGELAYEALDVPKMSGSATVTHTWAGATLEPGMIYQFRVRSFHEKKTGERTYISASEDLKGVFLYQP